MEQPRRGQVGDNPRSDGMRGWQSTPRSQQPGNLGRHTSSYTGHDIGIANDRYRHDDRSYGGREPYGRHDGADGGQHARHFEGRVQRLEHGSGGYRVWLDHGDHCFWIPEARFLLWPLHVGLSVSFGGFWNSAGYYNVDDYGPIGGPYYGNSYYGSSYYGNSNDASSTLQGYVDRFDGAAGTFVLRDDSSGRYATVLISGGDPQFQYLQPGDWVTLAGVWTRGGYFEAYRIENLAQR